MKILFLQQQRIKPKSPCPNFDLPYPHFQDSAFYSAHWTPTCSHFGLVVCRIVRSHTEPANRALAVCRIAPLTHRTGKPCVQNCPIAHRTGEPCPCGVQNCPIAHRTGEPCPCSVCRIARSHTEPANRALAVCRIARSHTWTAAESVLIPYTSFRT